MDEDKLPTRLPMKAGGQLQPIIPETFEDVQRLANLAVQSGLFKGQGDGALAQATIVLMKGMEIGIQPMQALEGIAIINGRSVIWGDLLPGLIRAHGHQMKEWREGEGDNMVAKCQITRGDTKEVIEEEFSVADARKAGLWGKGTWEKYPKRMLKMRARGFAARDGVADVLKGLMVREEMEDVAVRDMGNIVAVSDAPPPPPPPETGQKTGHPEPEEETVVWDKD